MKGLGVKLHVERVVVRFAQHVELTRDAQQVVVVVVNFERLDREMIRLEDQAGRDLAYVTPPPAIVNVPLATLTVPSIIGDCGSL
jgi:hypothetical protein